MNGKELLVKYKPLIIIILLLSLMFLLRAQSVNINGVSDQLKPNFQDDQGLPYFSEMDSYYNYRLTRDYLDHGYLGDTIINGTQWDLHSFYPPGRSAEYPPMIVYITAFFYKFINLFTVVPLTAVCIWIAPFIASLSAIPAYLFVRQITNDYGGITAGILVGLAPSYFAHTFAGFFDTDMYNILLPLLVVWFFVESIIADNIRKRTIFVVLSAISMLVFSMSWQGWWYIFYLLIVFVLVYLLITRYLFHKRIIKPVKDYSSKFNWFQDQREIFSLVMFLVISSILMLILLGFSGFTSSLLGAVGFTQLQAIVQSTAYPNVFISVSELQIPTLTEVLGGVGGILAFIFGIFSIPLLIWQLRKNNGKKEGNGKKVERSKEKKSRTKVKKTRIKESEKIREPIIWKLDKYNKNYLLYAVLLLLWLLITAYSMTKGVRFVSTFSLPIGIGAGIFVGLSVKYIKERIDTPVFSTITILLLICLVAYTPVSNAYTISNSVVPGTDDYMWNSLEWINKNTPPNTVITSWWDYGHLFTAVADRPVTFDGGSQNSAQAYWVGKALLTDNETLSAGILRMLTTSGDLGYTTMDGYTKDTGKSVEILNKILGVDKVTALNIMTNEYKMNPQDAQKVLKYTHPDNPTPHVFITSSDMIGKSGWWSYFGSWDFQNSEGQHYFYSVGAAANKTLNNTTVILGENNVTAIINGTNITSGLLIEENKIIPPHKLTVIENNRITEERIVSNESPISIILINDKGSYMTVIMNKELDDAMFTKLFFLKGANLNNFKLAYEQPGVMVWNVS